MRQPSPTLPIDAVLDALGAALAEKAAVVLVAPPGAGKTTRVPLQLMNEPWVRGRKLILLEPRRLAARAAAARMAETLGESVGETIGLRVRLETKVSAKTKIEVVTEGVFVRMIVDDPEMTGVAAALFDEFHERSLDTDLGLALALESQSALRQDLRLIVMSATLDGARVADLLGGAPLIASRGRAHPVETRYVSRNSRLPIEDETVRVIEKALDDESGSILAFLPGRKEIERAADKLRSRWRDAFVVAPLHGSLDREAQDQALRPAASGRRKIVLATSIAETSLTIEGVRVVVDSGLARQPRYEPGLGLTRLETVRVSRASADQRRGRAGRTEPGVCYRMWEEAATGAFKAFAPPEILSADLAGFVLDLAAWGARDPSALAWLDPPPRPALAEARALLEKLGAIAPDGAITPEGRAMRALPLPPRLSRMVVAGARMGKADLAAQTALALVERGLGGQTIDIAERVSRLQRDRSRHAQDARRLALSWARTARESAQAPPNNDKAAGCGPLLALAFPDRIAKARGRPGQFLMANGRAAALDPADPLAQEDWIVIADASGGAASQRIIAAAALTAVEAEEAAGAAIQSSEDLTFDPASSALRARRRRRLGAILIAEQNLPVPKGPGAALVLVRGVATLGIDRLPWRPAQKQWRDRILFLRRTESGEWPDVSDAALTNSVESWLAPFVEDRDAIAAISSDDLERALKSLLDWRLARRLDEDAPTHFVTPAGSTVPIDYQAEGAPVLAVRVQELYGLSDHPRVASGRAALTLHLLSPARRPVQITRDLPGFWKGSWAQVKAEMRARYPRHAWPDDPAHAEPTLRAKKRG